MSHGSSTFGNLTTQVVCALQTHQPALAAAAGAVGIGTPAAEVPMLRFKVGL